MDQDTPDQYPSDDGQILEECVARFASRLEQKYNFSADEPVPDSIAQLILRLEQVKDDHGAPIPRILRRLNRE
ncbi:MAG: hypothetical protein AAF996_16060 [Pseudomonadota bacterium]